MTQCHYALDTWAAGPGLSNCSRLMMTALCFCLIRGFKRLQNSHRQFSTITQHVSGWLTFVATLSQVLDVDQLPVQTMKRLQGLNGPWHQHFDVAGRLPQRHISHRGNYPRI